jgi:protein-S-isoprenylcysteine O-methyltransferase Ste14
MLKDPFHWFPDPYFSTILFIMLILVALADILIPRLANRTRVDRPSATGDRGSFVLIQVLSLAGVVVAITLRRLVWGLLPASLQYLGLLLIPAGIVVRSWAILKLGRFFSRVVEIETTHRLITSGPYRWLRHPAYTGMLMINLGFGLALGTWPGALLMLVLPSIATLYRIQVEEKILLQAFGDEYRSYMQHTWRLFPGW